MTRRLRGLLIRKTLWLMILITASVAWRSPAGASQNGCDLNKPPKDSAATEDHGVYFFIYPRSLPASYTGCQTMWDEHDQKWFALVFDKGELTNLAVANPNKAEPLSNCSYLNRNLIAADSAPGCPPYGMIGHGLGPIKADEEPKVPPDRDPRTK